MTATSIKNTHNRQTEILNWKLKNDFYQLAAQTSTHKRQLGDRSVRVCEHLLEHAARFSRFSWFSFLFLHQTQAPK